MKSLTLCLLFTLSSLTFALPSAPVTTSSGPVIGETLTIASRPITRFLGIPYAAPPLGGLRFHRPQPPTTWTSPLTATRWPNLCIQDVNSPLAGADNAQLLRSQNISEDCLYLNLWTPGSLGDDAQKTPKPVIVWIHGGGLVFGTASFDIYDGEMLAAKADAVVVSFNYRVSMLGFLYSEEVPEVKGNQGFWDQALVLAWVQANIASFGGDPKQVTIMGESAGAWSVSAHILSPQTRNLYQRAILQSGALVDYPMILSPAEHQTNFLTGIRKVGCAAESDKIITRQVVECLQGLDPFLVESVFSKSDKLPLEPLLPLAVIDGTFILAKPELLLASGAYKTSLSLLVSTVEDEGSFILALYGGAEPGLKAKDPAPLSLPAAQSFFGNLLKSTIYQNRSVPEDLINTVYYAGLDGKSADSDEIRKRTGVAFGDLLLGCPTLSFAHALYANSPSTATVYQMHYKAKLGKLKMVCNAWAGACHCDDLYPTFGLPFRHPEEYLEREREISGEIIDYLAAFIREGTPGAKQPEWKPYLLGPDGKEVVRPYYEITGEPKKPESFKFNLKQLECSIWKRFYQ